MIEMCPLENVNLSENNTPELFMAILFEQGAIPVSIFGINDTITASLLAGFAYANDNFFKYLSTALDNVDFGEEHKILNNFMNKGFYLAQFTNHKNNKKYGLLFRPVNEKLFCRHWINKIIIKITNKLEKAEDISQTACDLLNSFNFILLNELKIIHSIYEQEYKEDSENKIIFRRSGARVCSFNNPKIEKVFNIILNDFEFSSKMSLIINGFSYSVEQKESNNIDYLELKINPISK
ncbi:MAG: hypothetical protein ACFFCM_02415 [Promethearchaeota archaeon]